MPLPIVAAPVVTTVPPVPAKAFDQYHVSEIHVVCPDPNGPTLGKVVLRKGLVDPATGAWELSPTDDPVTLVKPSLGAAARTDPDLGAVVGALLAYIAVWAARPVPEGLTPVPPPEPQPGPEPEPAVA
jgi:hypothetical protein